MKAYVVKDRSGAIKMGWLLRNGISIQSIRCRLRTGPAPDTVEEVSVETALSGAAVERRDRQSYRQHTRESPK